MEPVKVMKYHIDTNGHMNNCHYVSVAMELLGDDERFTQVRVEYKKSAVYGDTIIPKVCKEEERTVVVLCDSEGKEYAVVELK
jgi:acyl-ACP thioesterase